MTQSRQKSRGFQILWTILTTLVIVSFGALLYYGREVYQGTADPGAGHHQ